MDCSTSFVILVIFSVAIPASLACDGYKLNVKSLKNCGGGSDIFKLDDGFTSTLTPECHVKPKGCVTVSQDIKQAMVTYDVVKNGMMPLKGNVDACKEMKKSDEKTIELVMTLVGIPPECPIPQGKRCANDTSIDISEHKSKMPAAAGSYKGKLKSDHGDGMSTCIEFEASLDR